MAEVFDASRFTAVLALLANGGHRRAAQGGISRAREQRGTHCDKEHAHEIGRAVECVRLAKSFAAAVWPPTQESILTHARALSDHFLKMGELLR